MKNADILRLKRIPPRDFSVVDDAENGANFSMQWRMMRGRLYVPASKNFRIPKRKFERDDKRIAAARLPEMARGHSFSPSFRILAAVVHLDAVRFSEYTLTHEHGNGNQ